MEILHIFCISVSCIFLLVLFLSFSFYFFLNFLSLSLFHLSFFDFPHFLSLKFPFSFSISLKKIISLPRFNYLSTCNTCTLYRIAYHAWRISTWRAMRWPACPRSSWTGTMFAVSPSTVNRQRHIVYKSALQQCNIFKSFECIIAMIMNVRSFSMFSNKEYLNCP